MRFLRLLYIVQVVIRFGLHEFLPAGAIRTIGSALQFWRTYADTRAVRLRHALEALGPIFVKFGQLLSTRPDLVPAQMAEELARLQDQVPPFAEADVLAALSQAYSGDGGRTWCDVFATFDMTPVASASVAQVHFATLAAGGPHAGRGVAVKILRPHVAAVIARDVALLDVLAGMVEALYEDGRRLRLRKVVAEFDKTLHDELDLVREAANASTLRRNFSEGTLLYVPEVYFDLTRRHLMVLERIDAIAVDDVDALRAHGIDLKRLAEDGVKIFFTQVFRDGFFHADMHPGNIFVGRNGIYTGVDFGIMGTLSDADRNYLARNFAAFFRRDYKAVARAHIEAGWVPQETREDEFESAVRAVCEPIFDKPLSEISFGTLLVRLFDVSRRFRMEVQPQLVLLQKTLLQIEGLGRQLYPQLDLRAAAQPILERFISEQSGWRGALRQLRHEGPQWAAMLPQLPRLVHRALESNPAERLAAIEAAIERVNRTQQRQSLLLAVVIGMVSAVVATYLYLLLFWGD